MCSLADLLSIDGRELPILMVKTQEKEGREPVFVREVRQALGWWSQATSPERNWGNTRLSWAPWGLVPSAVYFPRNTEMGEG